MTDDRRYLNVQSRVLCIVMCIVMCAAFALAGCSKKPRPDDGVVIDVANTTAPTESAAEPTLAPTEQPTEAPTEEPSYSPAPTALPAEPPAGQALWLNTMPTELYGVDKADAEAWFSDAVFIGDSITLGWKNYNNNKLESDPAFFGQTHFLCEGSYGAGHALEPVSASSLHPVYQGEQRQLWDSVKRMGAKKVFMCFGLNDIAIYGVDGTVQNFNKVCDKLLEADPELKIFIISSMYMYKGSEMNKLNNPNLRALNAGLREMCSGRGFTFVDIASHLVDAEGYLKPEYSSDNYVHQTFAAYDIWAEILRSIAAHNIVWGY